MKIINKINLFIFALFSFINLIESKVFIFNNNINNNEKIESLKNDLSKLDIKYRQVQKINIKNNNLYIIFDAHLINNFPQNYIVMQTLDLNNNIPNNYLNVLEKSIAVWDYNWSNIKKYESKIKNYYYYPKNYEFFDPVILPCLLPINSLKAYKNLLIYSNANNTDISSHLPTLFARGLLADKIDNILEVGIRGGESTKALYELAKLKNSKLIGLDIDCSSVDNYKNLLNTSFYCIDDTKFDDLYKDKFNGQKFDIIFIDTSHLYDHTMKEIEIFLQHLAPKGKLIFHDTHMQGYYPRLNNTFGGGWDRNNKGVSKAIIDTFKISFNEEIYNNFTFDQFNTKWNLIHYPFCHGLTIISKL